MANSYGFVQKKYPQPITYQLFFTNWNAIYRTKKGVEIMLEAVPYCLTKIKEGAKVDHYDILVRGKECRKTIRSGIKTLKRAMEILQELIDNN